ncbi:MAG TPA: amidohydrolase family protein [Bacteroidia bacterium]|nr:amidohydrolase family protein [Bacteroidia bacterium]
MRFLQADILYPISTPPVKHGILVMEDDGRVIEIIDPKIHPEEFKRLNSDPGKLEIFHGILCPGFVNAHCHLELSHLKGKLDERKRLPAFLKQVSSMRQSSTEEILEALEDADREMVSNGIVAVGDISNTDHSFQLKSQSRIHYLTFVEMFDFHPERAEGVFEKGKQLLDQLNELGLEGTLVPHAPYTVSSKLFRLINEYAYICGSPVCMHNQETESENEMFLSRKGELFDFLDNAVPFFKEWKATGHPSLASTLIQMSSCSKIQLVHNTYSTQKDIERAMQFSKMIWWCFCPNANLFIENRLPDIPLFLSNVSNITVGTDSYASNWTLSVLDELKSIHRKYPEISLDHLLKWSTLNGAEFLGMHRELGSFEKNKIPGVNLVSGIDQSSGNLNDTSQVLPLF